MSGVLCWNDRNVWELHRGGGHTALWMYEMPQTCSFENSSFHVTYNPPWLPAACRIVSKFPSPPSSPSSIRSQASFPQSLRGLLCGTQSYHISEPQIFWDDPIPYSSNFKIKARGDIWKENDYYQNDTSAMVRTIKTVLKGINWKGRGPLLLLVTPQGPENPHSCPTVNSFPFPSLGWMCNLVHIIYPQTKRSSYNIILQLLWPFGEISNLLHTALP